MHLKIENGKAVTLQKQFNAIGIREVNSKTKLCAVIL